MAEWGPREEPDSSLKYYAYRYPKLYRCVNTVLCPLTCGFFWVASSPGPITQTSVGHQDGLTVQMRMADRHFAREGRRFDRRESLTSEHHAGKVARIFKGRKKFSKQSASALFSKLPFEIRSAIFEYVLFDTGAVFVGTTRINPDDWHSFHKIQTGACELELQVPPDFSDLQTVSPGFPVFPSRLSLALLQTCRLAYIEAIPILYSQTQFVFEDPRHLVAFSRSIPPPHFAHIRSFRLQFSKMTNYDDWHKELRRFVDSNTFITPLRNPMQQFDSVLRSMQRLRSLYITFKIMAKVQQSTRLRLSQADFDNLMIEIHKYHERTREATTSLCKVHLLVYNRKKLVCQKTKRGLIEADKSTECSGKN